MVESGRRADGKREEGRRVKRVDAGIAVEAHPSAKTAKDGAPHILTVRVLHRNIRIGYT
jgi:hypothetical protein